MILIPDLSPNLHAPPFIAGNWKMYKTVQETVFYIKQLRALRQRRPRRRHRRRAAVHGACMRRRKPRATATSRSPAQNVYWEREGAFTGEVSAAMLREAGAEYVIIGHSERRTLFGETDLTVNRKLVAALGARLVPIVCIGETLEQREANQTLDVLDRQVQQGLDGVTAEQLAELVLAYEPVWAIGTGRNATPEQAQEAHAHIRTRLRQWFGADAAERCHILYGGSVKPDNIAALRRPARRRRRARRRRQPRRPRVQRHHSPRTRQELRTKN